MATEDIPTIIEPNSAIADGYDSNSFIAKLKPLLKVADSFINSNNTAMSYETLEHNTTFIVHHMHTYNKLCILRLFNVKCVKVDLIKIAPISFLESVIERGIDLDNPICISVYKDNTCPKMCIAFRPIDSAYSGESYKWTSS